MKFQSQPNMWSCSVASAAMVMNIPIHDLISLIGHDGSEIMFPDLPEPVCRAGFTIQEIVDAALKMGWSMTPIEAMPQCTPNGKNIRDVFPETKERMDHYFAKYSGLVEGERLDGKYWHNVAWDHEEQLWHDPSGPITKKPTIKVATFWVFMKNEHFMTKSFLDSIIKRPKPDSLPDYGIEPNLLAKPVEVRVDLSKPLVNMGPKRFS